MVFKKNVDRNVDMGACFGPGSNEWWLCENCEGSKLLSELMKRDIWFCGKECCFADSQAFLRYVLHCQNLNAFYK